MYGLVRVLLAFIVFLVLFVIIRWAALKRFSKLSKKWIVIIAMISCFGISSVLWYLPIENAFFSFNSPEDAFGYVNQWNYDIKLVISGKYCDLVVGERDGNYKDMAVQKDTDVWKLPFATDLRKVTGSFVDEGIISVYQYKSSNDYFISLLGISEKAPKVTDSQNSKFYVIETTSVFSDQPLSSYSCYAHLSSFDKENYWIDVNGVKITFSE